MDCLLRPDKLKTLPEDPDAAKVFEYFSNCNNFSKCSVANMQKLGLENLL